MVVEDSSFLELDISQALKILKSSELMITSEVEVCHAALRWLSHDIDERGKFAKDLLQNVRLTLLSDDALVYLKTKMSSISKLHECTEILNNLLERKNMQSKTAQMSRYCNQNEFIIFKFGGRRSITSGTSSIIEDIKYLDARSLSTVKNIRSTNKGRSLFSTACLKGEIYVFGGTNSKDEHIMSVDKYSPRTDAWSKISDMFDSRYAFCACSFIDELFVIGGATNSKDAFNSCFKLNTRNNRWKEVAAMNQERSYFPCAIFKEKVVVSGGRDVDFSGLKTAECYDAFGNTWTRMPDMLSRKSGHSLIAVHNKLFAVGGNGENCCEVLDDVCSKFVAVKSPIARGIVEAVAVGDKFFVFKTYWSPLVYEYDVQNEDWCERSCEAVNNVDYYSCVTLPKF